MFLNFSRALPRSADQIRIDIGNFTVTDLHLGQNLFFACVMPTGTWPGLKIRGTTEILLGHALYFSEDLLLPPLNYFLNDSTEIPSTILAKSGVLAPHTPS